MIKMVILVLVLTITFTNSVLKAEYWNETYSTPDGTCGKVYSYDLNEYLTASAYASVTKTNGTLSTRVDTYAFVSSDYYKNKNDEINVSAGFWSFDVWYSNDPINNTNTGFAGDVYKTVSGGKTFLFKKPRDVKGKSGSNIANNPNETEESFPYLADAEVDFGIEESIDTESPAFGLSTANGSNTAVSGETVEFNLTTDSGYSNVDWFVRSPNDISADVSGTLVESDSGDESTFEATFSYTFPSQVGTYEIEAHITRDMDGSTYNESYTVRVGS